MKISNTAISFVLVFGLFTFSAQADNKNRSDIEPLITQLSLDQTKTQKLKDLMQQHHLEMGRLRDQSKINHQAKRDMRVSHREQLLTVLNYKQLYQFDEYMRQNHPRRGKFAAQ